MTAPETLEVDGRSIWEVVIRMDQKLDTALSRIEDHENRIRETASQSHVDALTVQIQALALSQANLEARPVVTPKTLLAASGSTVALILGLITLLDRLMK